MFDVFFVSGHVLTGGAFLQGHVEVRNGSIVNISQGPPPQAPLAEGLVLPGLRNTHTHVGDAAVPPPPPDMGPSDIFPPPDGYKHRMLAEMPATRLEEGVISFLDAMTAHGTVEHVDFREGGVAGVEMLMRARRGALAPPRTRIFGRPARQTFHTPELDRLFAMVDGIGLSAAMDWPREPIEDVVAHAHAAGKPVALHCSETRREDLSWVLELEPHFLVHMVFGTPEDFADLAAANIPVVVCPRSTSRFTRAPPVTEMARAGLRIGVGTDNAMLQGPNVLDEVAFILTLPGVQEALDPIEVLSWAMTPTKGSNNNGNIGLDTGSRDLAVLPLAGDDPLSFVKDEGLRGANLVMTDGRLWRR